MKAPLNELNPSGETQDCSKGSGMGGLAMKKILVALKFFSNSRGRDETMLSLSKRRDVLTSSGNIVEKWKEQSEELFTTVEMPSCQKAATEISGVFESISVAKVIVAVRNPHSNKAAGI